MSSILCVIAGSLFLCPTIGQTVWFWQAHLKKKKKKLASKKTQYSKLKVQNHWTKDDDVEKFQWLETNPNFMMQAGKVCWQTHQGCQAFQTYKGTILAILTG